MANGNGIEWLMELDAKLDGARAMVKELSASEKAADDADKALKKMEGHTFGGLFKEIFKAELAMKALEKGAELAWEGIKKVGEKMLDSIQLAAGAERTSKAFENMLGKEGGKETLEYLDKFAEKSEFTGGALKRMSGNLLEVGLRGADFRNALGAASDVAAKDTVDKMAAFEGAISSFARIARVGKVDNRTLAGLKLNPHDVADQLSKDLGLSKETIKKQLEAGTLDGVKAMQSIFSVMEKKTGRQLGGLGMEMATGMEARIDKLKDLPEEMAKNLRNTQGFKDIEESLGGFLDTVAPRLLGTNGAMGKLLDVIGEKIKGIDWDQVVTKFEQLVGLAEKWVDPIEKVAKGIVKIAEAVLALPSLGEKIGDVAGNAAILLKTGVVGQTAEEKHQKWSDVEYERRMAAMNSHELVRGTADGISKASGESQRAGADLMGAVDKGARDAAEIHSPSALFARHGRALTDGLAEGMESGASRVTQASASVMPTPDTSGLRGGSGGFNAGGVTIQFEVNVGGGSQSSASEIADELNTRIPSMLISALEQLAVQAAVA